MDNVTELFIPSCRCEIEITQPELRLLSDFGPYQGYSMVPEGETVLTYRPTNMSRFKKKGELFDITVVKVFLPDGYFGIRPYFVNTVMVNTQIARAGEEFTARRELVDVHTELGTVELKQVSDVTYKFKDV